jgi:hypothetical protein
MTPTKNCLHVVYKLREIGDNGVSSESTNEMTKGPHKKPTSFALFIKGLKLGFVTSVFIIGFVTLGFKIRVCNFRV